MANTFQVLLPSIANNGTSQAGMTSVANMIPVIGFASGQSNLNVLLVSSFNYEGAPNNPANANGAYHDGNNWLEASNTATVNRSDSLFTASDSFATGLGYYLYAPLSEPADTVEPKPNHHTNYPFAP